MSKQEDIGIDPAAEVPTGGISYMISVENQAWERSYVVDETGNIVWHS